ncbi:MAG: universal stress protein [Geminicoccaceae bacterium]|nr:universal stress protein [Geminicoccaceae bacterium]MDW8369374.1 universal stress protein [Geminicoccaceae bacterium]
MDEEGTAGRRGPRPPQQQRVFLVLVDDSEEMANALRFACRRARHTNGRVALLYVIEPVEFQHWLGVGRLMEEDARAAAEQRMQTLAARVFEQTGTMPAIYIREGSRAEELLALIEEEPSISLLVLATASGTSNPGPVVSYLLGNLRRLKIPVTLVPGELTAEEIDAVT